MAAISGLSRALLRACYTEVSSLRAHSQQVMQHRCNSSSSYSIYTPKASTKRNDGRSPRWQTQQRFGRKEAVEHRGGVILLDSGQKLPQLDTSASQHLKALLDALERHELEPFWTALVSLQKADKHAALHLSRQNHSDVLRACINSRTSIQDGTLAKHWIDRFVQLAQLAAQTGDVKLLFGWFRLLIALHRSQSVIDIWQMLVADTISVQTKIPPRPSATSTTPNDSGGVVTNPAASFMTFGIGSEGHQVDVHDIACLVVIACHTSGNSKDVVSCLEKLELGTPFRTYFNMTKAKRICKDVCFAADDATLVVWSAIEPLFWQAELARGLSSGSGGPKRLARFMGSLFQLRQLEAAQHIFETAMSVSSGPSAWLAVEDAPRTSTVPDGRVQWTDNCWAVCLSGFIGMGATDQAMKVWSHYHAKKLKPTPRVWNALLDGYARVKKYDAAMATWREIMKQPESQQNSTFPDVQMFTTMINVLFRTRRADEATTLFSELVERSDSHGGPLHVTTETYNAIIHGLFFNGRHQRAQMLLDQMRTSGPAPNISTINTFLRAYARIGDLASLASTLRLIGDLKLTPDVVTFTTVLDALLRKGGESANESVVKMLKIMDAFGVKPNFMTYTAMIKASLNGAETSNIDLVTHTMFGRSDPAREPGSTSDASIEAALVLLDRMIEARVAPTEVTYSALIGGCVQYPDSVADAFDRGLIPRRYTSAPQQIARLGETRETIHDWQRSSPHVSLALLLLDQMRARRLPMTTPAYHYLIEGLCSAGTDRAAFLRSLDLMDEMLMRPSGKHGTDPNRQLGPFVSSVLSRQSDTPAADDPSMYTINHTSWVVILTSLLSRIEGSRNDATEPLLALNLAVRLVWATGSLGGTEGGRTLSRLVDRATALTKQRA